jgi:hypothetical protein
VLGDIAPDDSPLRHRPGSTLSVAACTDCWEHAIREEDRRRLDPSAGRATGVSVGPESDAAVVVGTAAVAA